MQWLASICVRRPVFATVLILVIVVVGIVGYSKLGVDRFPNVDLPIVVVITALPGAAPEEVETEITDKIEEAVNTISGIDELRSISTEGVSQVFVTLHARQGRRRRRAGGARPLSTGAARSARGHQTPGRQQARSRRVRRCCSSRWSPTARSARSPSRRPRDAPGAGEHHRRRPGDDPRRAQAPDPRLPRSRQAARRAA